jgi:hypothetical protein
MRGISPVSHSQGPKARHVIARPKGPGSLRPDNPRGLKGRPDDRTAHVSPLQGGRHFVWTCSRAYSPGCHIAGFQPYSGDVLKLPPFPTTAN